MKNWKTNTIKKLTARKSGTKTIWIQELIPTKHCYARTWDRQKMTDFFLFDGFYYDVYNLKIEGTTIRFSLYDEQGFISNNIVDNVSLVRRGDKMILLPLKQIDPNLLSRFNWKEGVIK
jgi:hypothetical protein